MSEKDPMTASMPTRPDNPSTDVTEEQIWDAYNLLLGGPDLERLRKMIARYELFRRTIDLPGDVVEAGVFKGTGLLYFLKLIMIHAPGSLKRVVGFDLFQGFEDSADTQEKNPVRALMQESNFTGNTPDDVHRMVASAGFPKERCELIAGDIGAEAKRYVAENPGFRISLLNMDLDLGRATAEALDVLWPRVVPGGMVILDEYAIGRWSASEGVDAWISDKQIRIQTLPWSRSPTAYFTKSL
jgi:hypothetical protein